MLKSLALAVLPFALLACGESVSTSDDPQSMMPRLQAFESIRAGFDTQTSAHVGVVMKGEVVSHVVVEELEWARVASAAAWEMRSTLQELKACSNVDGEFVDIADASAALDELQTELHAHQVGMLTTVDVATAHASEQAHQRREALLLLELRAHFEAFEASAADYACAF